MNTLLRTPIVASSTPSTGAAMPARALYELAGALLGTRHLEEALDASRRALLLRPDDRAFQSRFAEALQANGVGGG